MLFMLVNKEKSIKNEKKNLVDKSLTRNPRMRCKGGHAIVFLSPTPTPTPILTSSVFLVLL